MIFCSPPASCHGYLQNQTRLSFCGVCRPFGPGIPGLACTGGSRRRQELCRPSGPAFVPARHGSVSSVAHLTGFPNPLDRRRCPIQLKAKVLRRPEGPTQSTPVCASEQDICTCPLRPAVANLSTRPNDPRGEPADFPGKCSGSGDDIAVEFQSLFGCAEAAGLFDKHLGQHDFTR